MDVSGQSPIAPAQDLPAVSEDILPDDLTPTPIHVPAYPPEEDIDDPFAEEHPTVPLEDIISDLLRNQVELQKNVSLFIQAQSSAARAPVIPATVTVAPTTSTRGPTTRVRDPEMFTGHMGDVDKFLNEMADCVRLLRDSLTTDEDKCLYFGRYLEKGTPIAWYNAIKAVSAYLFNDYDAFVAAFRTHFGDADITGTYLRKLDNLQQTRDVSSYLARFHEIVAHLDLTEESKVHAFYHGLSDDVKDYMVFSNPKTMEELRPLAVRIDKRLRERELEKKGIGGKGKKPLFDRIAAKSSHLTPSTAPALVHDPSYHPFRSKIPGTETVPMDVDVMSQNINAMRPVIRLTAQERQRRIDNDLCRYCGKPGHYISTPCPVKASNDAEAYHRQEVRAKAAKENPSAASSSKGPASMK